MDELNGVRKLLEVARHRVSDALQRGEMDEVIRLARVAKDFEAALRNLEMSVNRMADELKAHTAVPAAKEGENILQNATLTELSNKAWGNKTRREWVHQFNSQRSGHNLRQVKGVKYQTGSGRRVGIASARERDQLPFKWFLGLPDEHFDYVILLCQPQSGPMLDFVLPPDFVSRIWSRLSDHAGQKKFHVVQNGGNYELEPSLGLGKINQYLSRIQVVS